jgi:hypothetical protein
MTQEMITWLTQALGIDPAVFGAPVPAKGPGSPMTNPLGTVAPYNQQGRAIRDPATNARLSEAEHIQPRAIIADQMRNPATGQSPYDRAAYRESPTDKISRAAALDKTRGDMDALRTQRADPTDPQAQADGSLEAAIDRTLDAGQRTGDASITEEGVNLAAHGQMGVMHEVGKPDVRNIFKDLIEEEIDAAVAHLDEPVLAPEYAAPKGMGIPLRANGQGGASAQTGQTVSNEGVAQSATEPETPEPITDAPAPASSGEPPVRYRVVEEPPAQVRVAAEDPAPASEDVLPQSGSELPQPPLRRMTIPEPDGPGGSQGPRAAADVEPVRAASDPPGFDPASEPQPEMAPQPPNRFRPFDDAPPPSADPPTDPMTRIGFGQDARGNPNSPYAQEPRIGFGRNSPGNPDSPYAQEPRIGFGRNSPGDPASQYAEDPSLGFGVDPPSDPGTPSRIPTARDPNIGFDRLPKDDPSSPYAEEPTIGFGVEDDPPTLPRPKPTEPAASTPAEAQAPASEAEPVTLRSPGGGQPPAQAEAPPPASEVPVSSEPPSGGAAAEGGLGATAGAGLIGGAMGGAMAAYGDYQKVKAGQMSVGDAAIDVGAKTVETGGLTVAGSAIARAVGAGGAEAVAGAAGAEGGAASGALSGAASAGGIIGGVVGGGLALIDDVGKVKRGEMTGGHATVDVGVKAGVGIAAGIAGAEAGAAIGAAVGSIIPGAGTAVGFVAGAVVGAGVGYVASALTETETGKKIISAAGDAVDAGIDEAKKVGSAVADEAGKVADEAKKVETAVVEEAGKAVDAVGNAASAAEDVLGNAASSVGSALGSLFGD